MSYIHHRFWYIYTCTWPFRRWMTTWRRNVKRLNGKQLTVSSLNLFQQKRKIFQTKLLQQKNLFPKSLPERIDDSEHASSVSTVTSKDSAPPYPDISSLPVWDELYQSALDLSEPFYIVENMPGRCGRQTTRANHPADTSKQYWKVSLYHALIDHMIMELESRLIKSENRFYTQYLLHRVIGNRSLCLLRHEEQILGNF